MNIITIIIIKMLDLKASHFSSNLKYLTICYTLFVPMAIRFTGAENRCKRTKWLVDYSSSLSELKTKGKYFFLYYPFQSIWIINQDKLVPKVDIGQLSIQFKFTR